MDLKYMYVNAHMIFLLWPSFSSPYMSHVSCVGDIKRRRWFLANRERERERSTSGSVSSVLICHKCPLFPMAKDKGQRTYEEHAFLMWHPHQIHHSGLNRMPMTLYSSCNYRETMQQYERKLWRAHLPPNTGTVHYTSVLGNLNSWTSYWCNVWLKNEFFLERYSE